MVIAGLVVVRCVGYALVGLAFVLFIRWNEGIVVGDRQGYLSLRKLPD